MILSEPPVSLSKNKNYSPIIVWNSIGRTGVAAMFLGSGGRFLGRRMNIAMEIFYCRQVDHRFFWYSPSCSAKICWFVITPLHAALFPLSLLQLCRWFDQVHACAGSHVQQNRYLDPVLLLLCNALFFLKRIPKRQSHLPRFSEVYLYTRL